MEKLIELITIVNQIKIQRIEIIGKGRFGKDQKMKQLYEGIAKGKFKTNAEAAKVIYGENAQSTNISSLKGLLTNKILNTLFFINLSGSSFNPIQKNYYECHKLRAVVQILRGKGSRISSMEIAKKVLKKSLKYQFTEISLELSKLLRQHYSIYNKNLSKRNKYNAVVTEQFDRWQGEEQLDKMYEELIFELSDKRSIHKELVEKGKNYAYNARGIYSRLESLKIGQLSHLLFVLEHELSRNYPEIENTCNKAISYFESKGPLESKPNTLVFKIKLLSAYIPLQKFQEGEILATKILDTISVGSINWFVTLELYFLLSMHTGNYTQGANVLQQASNHKNFKKLKKQSLEMWLVYEAYIEYLKQLEILPKPSKNNFRVARFINEVPNFSKDKTGINISILVIQILLLVSQGKEAKVIDRVEALRTYVYTYLRKDDSLRSNCFIKMLLKMVECHFHKNGTIRKTKSLVEKLEETPISTKGHSQYIEIIPYEKLWQLALMKLGNRAY